MTVAEFIAKWRRVELKERSASQEHFLDLCRLVGHAPPATVDPTGQSFCFEKGATKLGGGDGFADVWKSGFFGWEYKGKHKDLGEAYLQLQQYRDSLENPPLLVVSDMDRVIVHTNFTGTLSKRYELHLDDLVDERNLDILRAVFVAPAELAPDRAAEKITEDAAATVSKMAHALRSRGLAGRSVARFLDRLVFCFFAEDVGLLPDKLFSRVLDKAHSDPIRFSKLTRALFAAMADGGDFGVDTIRHFNGNLFADVEVLTLTGDELGRLRQVAALDWGAIDPSIFGTLFERALDPEKRLQLGAHYTSREDIEAVVEPVVMVPLRREWDAVRSEADRILAAAKTKRQSNKALSKIRGFLEHLQTVTVLDPACGSGNFLYVVLQKLKNLEKQVILHAMEQGFPGFLPHVGPWQLSGLEISEYAHELAQMTVWIGYLQWVQANGFGQPDEPILKPLDTFLRRDSILPVSDSGTPSGPEWPKADFIIGNPPFLGGKKLRSGLSDSYVDSLFEHWSGQVPAEADLCCYWFEKARQQIESGRASRAGLLATQGIRGGANRAVLQRIKESGDIFFAEDDRPWVLDGAAVRVSMVGFDNGAEKSKLLNGGTVAEINADLTGATNLTLARTLSANLGVAFMADTKGGPFDIPEALAHELLSSPNPHGRPNSDVLRPWVNGLDVVRRPRGMWIIDFPPGTSEADASLYEQVFEYARKNIYPVRKTNQRALYAKRWWMHLRQRPEMRTAIAPLSRFLATLTVSKHRIFVWLTAPTLPDHQLIVFAREKDYTLGVLQSRIHTLWSLRQGTRLENRPRYTPTTTFERFPFPDPTPEQSEAISKAAKELDALRTRWLNPPELVIEEDFSFPAARNGPWSVLVDKEGSSEVGTATYRCTVPATEQAASVLKGRTLTALYNAEPAWLVNAHRGLDESVAESYGLSADLGEEALLEELLRLNLERSE